VDASTCTCGPGHLVLLATGPSQRRRRRSASTAGAISRWPRRSACARSSARLDLALTLVLRAVALIEIVSVGGNAASALQHAAGRVGA
jgi:hypothetical protein